jgi:xanthine dehydrogenase molybdenum-binding subunit
MESILDELTAELGIDPLEFRLRHCTEPGDELLPIFPGEFMSSVGARECLERGGEHIGWSRGRPTDQVGPLRRGLGVALTIHAAGHLVPATAQVEVAEDGSIIVTTPLPDIGSENETAQRQIAADALRISPERVHVRWGSTDDTGEDFGIHGSRGVFMIGQCVVEAATEVDRALRGLASARLGIPASDLAIEDGTVRARREDRSFITFADLATSAQAAGTPIRGVGRALDTNQVWGFAAHFAEVEVDTDTGEVRLLRLVAAADVGRAINPLIVEGQIEGAAIQGIGYALSEELVYDSVVRGTMLNDNLLGYEVPTILDVPLTEPIIIESFEPTHPLGAKGCGETGLVGVAPAIANAVANALGIRFYELPITPRKVLDALERHGHPRARAQSLP